MSFVRFLAQLQLERERGPQIASGDNSRKLTIGLTLECTTLQASTSQLGQARAGEEDVGRGELAAARERRRASAERAFAVERELIVYFTREERL